MKRRVWKVNPNRDGELYAYLIQGEEVVQGEIVAQEVCIKEDNGWRPTTKETIPTYQQYSKRSFPS
jgi:hypothetical protein